MGRNNLGKAVSSLWAEASQGSVSSAPLEAFLAELEGAQGTERGASADDVEWFRLYHAVAQKLEAIERGEEFGLPDGRWQDLGVQFEKLKRLYDGMERAGAINRVSWFLGGNALVDATDLRPIEQHLARQVLVRLRALGFEPSPSAASSPESSEAGEIRTTGPGLLRRLALKLGERVLDTVITVVVTALLTYLFLRFGFPA